LIVVLGACLAGFLGIGLALPGAALASTSPGRVRPPGPQSAQRLFAAEPTPTTVTASYSCDFSNYGSGIAAATVSATFAVETSWPVGQPQDIAMATTALSLPSAVSGKLSATTAFTVRATVTVEHGSPASVDIEGSAAVPSSSSPPTEVPVVTGVGQVTWPAKGTGVVELPPSTLTFQPSSGAGGSGGGQPSFACTTTASVQRISVTVGTASGPFYHCTTVVVPGGATNTTTDSGLVDMTVTASGTDQAGQTVTVTLASDGISALISSLAAELSQAGVQLTKATFASSLSVTGAQSGTLKLPATITDLTSPTLGASGSLRLTAVGKVAVHIPGTWSLLFFVGSAKVITISCTLVTTPAPVGLTLTVTASGSPSATPTSTDNGGEGNGSATPEDTGTPSGGVATGGGVAPGADMPLAAGGVVLLLAGGGLVTRGVARGRRRR
jgi:hypothetical protein